MIRSTFIKYLTNKLRPVTFLVEGEQDYYFTSQFIEREGGGMLFWVWASRTPGQREFYLGTLYESSTGFFAYNLTQKSRLDLNDSLHGILQDLADRLNRGEDLPTELVTADWQLHQDLAEGVEFDNFYGWIEFNNPITWTGSRISTIG